MLATVERARPTRVGDVVLAEAELVDQLAIGVGRLDRVEVLALEVLDERELELLAIGELADDRRDPLEAGRDARPGGGARRRRAGSRRCVSVTRIGWRTPCSAMLAVSVASAASSMRWRGWYGFGRIRDDRDLDGAGLAGGALRDERRRGRGRGPAAAPVGRSCSTSASAHRSAGHRDRDGAAIGREPAPSVAARGTRRRAPRRPRRPASRAVERDRLAVARRLREPDAARDRPSRRRASPRCRRTSAATSAERFVRPSYIVSTTPLIASVGVQVVADEVDAWQAAGSVLPGRSTRIGSG